MSNETSDLRCVVSELSGLSASLYALGVRTGNAQFTAIAGAVASHKCALAQLENAIGEAFCAAGESE